MSIARYPTRIHSSNPNCCCEDCLKLKSSIGPYIFETSPDAVKKVEEFKDMLQDGVPLKEQLTEVLLELKQRRLQVTGYEK